MPILLLLLPEERVNNNAVREALNEANKRKENYSNIFLIKQNDLIMSGYYTIVWFESSSHVLFSQTFSIFNTRTKNWLKYFLWKWKLSTMIGHYSLACFKSFYHVSPFTICYLVRLSRFVIQEPTIGWNIFFLR